MVNIRKVNKYMDRQAGGRDQDRVLASERSSASLETPPRTERHSPDAGKKEKRKRKRNKQKKKKPTKAGAQGD